MNISNTSKQYWLSNQSLAQFSYKNWVVSRSSGSRLERSGQEETEENWNILLKLEQSLETIGKSVAAQERKLSLIGCREGAESVATATTLSSLSEKLDNIQARLTILPNVRKRKDKDFFSLNLNEEIW